MYLLDIKNAALKKCEYACKIQIYKTEVLIIYAIDCLSW